MQTLWVRHRLGATVRPCVDAIALFSLRKSSSSPLYFDLYFRSVGDSPSAFATVDL